ncbi:MAG: hypothetical protein CVV64_20560 [Candidatus Wallbacteria bacterium HGW-Wallbacteria-1]|jgi:diguanylate cyclase (GGDEF)-like protein|uniref:Diguanylate cyclase n=1 Tax=Candidatus Wallbacteria bacterium HGW-Wallbacteria-1 TaxID=2013854 RepID=A0A2N1PI60_9BACT|nr:MAG: hypothetical protein CVV64_20560 [Candidatus Wallbacteria bacterium HGW-Wallbacteria-1]
MRLRTRLSLTFGLLTLAAAVIASYAVFIQIYGNLETLNSERLDSVATLVARSVDPENIVRFTRPSDWFNPDYRRLKRKLMDFQRANSLSWVALYRYDGTLFRAIADGSEQGDSFCPDFPIYDVSENMQKALSGEGGLVSTYTDAYGTYLMANTPVKNRSGEVVAIVDVSLSASKLTEAKKAAMTRAIAITLGIMAFTILVSFIVSSRLAKPVGLLEAGARELASGNLEHQVQSASGSPLEIAYLTGAFNDMAHSLLSSQNSLKMRITELGALCDLSKELSFAPNVDTVIESVLAKIVETTGCSCAAYLSREEMETQAPDHYVPAPDIDTEDYRNIVTQETAEVAETLNSGKINVSTAGNPHFLVIPVRSEDRIPGVVICFGNLRNSTATSTPTSASTSTPTSSSTSSPSAASQINQLAVPGMVTNAVTDPFSESKIHFAETVTGHLGLVLEKIRLYELAITDGLTGLYVHRYFQGALEREIKRARRYKTETSLLLFDIDHFKNFNDTYGHQMGDVVLSQVAGIICGTIRDNLDIASRYGGEEFTIILPETGTESALLVAERLRVAIASHEFTNGVTTVHVTISIGISTFPVHSEDRMTLIARADEALYECKEGGRNCCRVWEPKS